MGDDPYASSGLGLATYLVHGEDNGFFLGNFPMGWFALLFPLTVAGVMIGTVWAAFKHVHKVTLICCIYVVFGLILYLNINNYLDNPNVDMTPMGFTVPHWGILSTLVIYIWTGLNTAVDIGLVKIPGLTRP